MESPQPANLENPETGQISTDIFKYKLGDKTIHVDPLVIERRWRRASASVGHDNVSALLKIMEGPDWLDKVVFTNGQSSVDGITLKDWEGANAARDDAQAQLMPLIYETLGLSPLDVNGNGVTEVAALRIFTRWNEYRFDVKKNTESTSNNASAPDSSSPTPEFRPTQVRTKSGLGGGGIVDGLSPFAPSPFPKGSPSPSEPPTG